MPKSKYNHLEIEKKWQKIWEDTNLYKTPELKEGDKKRYILEAFPYPSGDGLHVGHVLPTTAGDVTARYSALKGFKVLHPIGWDAFGLPTENFAKKKGLHPQIVTNNSISNFKAQIKRLGVSYDWDREVNTSDPAYYKWTQWFFQLLYKRGLAYKKEALVNWDPVDKTVLANEQVLPDGTAERSGAKVEQKMMSQWFFQITDYAERLLNDLDELDWPQSTKQMQRNWIGKSIGAEVDFDIENTEQKITVFTTAHDTIFGVSFIVLSPEHPLVQQLVTLENKQLVSNYQNQAKQKSTLERTDLNKDKSGIFTGSFAINPINGVKVPIYIADYVLSNYGTGAVMGVPGEDERDFEFATKYNLAIIYTNHTNQFVSYSQEIKPTKDKYTLINSDEFNGLTYKVAREQILQKLINSGAGKPKITYRLRDWSIGRQRYWGCPIPIYYNQNGSEHLIPEQDLPLLLPQDLDMSSGMIKPLSQNHEFINSAAKKYGEGAKYEADTMDTFVCSSWYYFRYCSPNNQEVFADKHEMEKWMPVDQYIIGAEHSTLHLLYARFFTKVLFDAGFINFEEPFIKMRHQGLILGPDNQKMSKSKGNVVNPNEVFDEYGADTLRMYEMFMGPFDQPKPWSTSSIKGVRRLLERVWNLQERVYYYKDEVMDKLNQNNINYGPQNENTIEYGLHKLIKKVGVDIESFSFNTSVAEYMKFMNLVELTGAVTWHQLLRFLIVLHPFAPFITEEIYHNLDWEHIQEQTKNQCLPKQSISQEQFPSYSEKYLIQDTVKMVVQINGKVRAEFEIDTNIDENIVLEQAKIAAASYLEGKTIKFSKVVPNKLVSFVIQ